MTFKKDLAYGQETEKRLQETLFENIETIPAFMFDQKRGIDFTCLGGPDIHTDIEVKRDNWVDKTGNIFVELAQGLRLEKPGWALTSEADLIVVQGDKHLYFLSPKIFSKVMVIATTLRWKSHTTDNKSGYNAQGLLIPAKEICKFSGLFAPFTDYASLVKLVNKCKEFQGNFDA